MKIIPLAIAATALLGAQAFAGESYREPSDLRTAGVVTEVSTVKLQMRDADPFSFRTVGSMVNENSILAPSSSEQGVASLAGTDADAVAASQR